MPEPLVLDASVGVRIALEDQEGHEEANRCLERAYAAGHDVLVPDLFLYEMGSALSRGPGAAARRARILLASFETVEVARPAHASFARAMDVAQPGKLSFYDAAYLALAEERNATLWTEDRELLKRFPGRTASTAELMRRLR